MKNNIPFLNEVKSLQDDKYDKIQKSSSLQDLRWLIAQNTIEISSDNLPLEPAVSICMITYNHHQFIKDALEGVIAQKTTFEIELIVSDDYSTDGTQNILLDYQKIYPNLIRVLLAKKNLGQITPNKNAPYMPNVIRAIDYCRGKYIALCEGDDYWIDSLKLQKQVDFLEANEDYSLCFHNAKIQFMRSGNFREWIMHESLDKTIFETKDLLRGWFIPTASIMARNYGVSMIPEWFHHCQSGDIPLLLLWSLMGKIKYLNEVMSVYRLHENGITASANHGGYNKVISMIFLYQSFNIDTKYKYNDEIMIAIISEINTHLPEIKELKAEVEKFKAELTFLKVKHKIKNFIKKYFLHKFT